MPTSSALAFDTHASVKRLMQSGMPEAQAEALVEVVSKTADMPDISNLMTKSDLEQLSTSTKADLTVLDARITAVKGELIYWIIGAGAVSTLAQIVPHFIK